MDDWRILDELDRMREWDTDTLVDTLNITPTEILCYSEFLERAINWIEENME